MEKTYSIENYGHGYIVEDFSGNRGKFGVAYAGRDGMWRDQPLNINPFQDKQTAEEFAKAECSY